MKRRNILVGGAAVASLASCGGRRDQAIVDHIVVRKAQRTMVLYQGSKEVAEYKVDLGFAPRGHKQREGDGKTPEGRYRITYKNPNSAFHLSLHISYPDANDVAYAKARGWNPGGEIFIHGGPNLASNRGKKDWTAGCISVSDSEMEKIYSLVKVGALIDIRA